MKVIVPFNYSFRYFIFKKWNPQLGEKENTYSTYILNSIELEGGISYLKSLFFCNAPLIILNGLVIYKK